MHSVSYVTAFGALLAVVTAIPMKRDMIVNTVTEVDVVTEIMTATVWVDATDAPDLHAAQYTHAADEPYTASSWFHTTHAEPITPSSVYVAPPAPTSTSSVYVATPAPVTTSSSSTSTAQVVTPIQSQAPEPATPVPASTSVYAAPSVATTTSTSQYVAPTSVYTPESTPTYTAAAAPTTTSSTAAAVVPTTSTASKASSMYTGDITFYDVGLGSCGYTNTDSEAVVAMAVGLMDKATMCGKSVTISLGGVTKTATVVDTCMGCANGNLDMSPTLFEAFAPLASGRVTGAQWSFN